MVAVGRAAGRGRSTFAALCALAVLLAVVPAPARAIDMAVSEARLCELVELALVGKVVGRQFVQSDDPLFDIDTEMTIEVESLMKGAEVGTVTVVVPGGELEGRSIRVAGMPPGEIGSRYVLLLQKLSEEPGQSPRWVVLKWRSVGAGGTVPSSQLLGRVWREHCDPAYDRDLEGRPSAPFMAEAPPAFLQWCSHY